MEAGTQEQLTALAQLYAELAKAANEEESRAARSPSADGSAVLPGSLAASEESLVAEARRSLGGLAAACGAAEASAERQRAVAVALDGAELVMRGELLRGRSAELPGLLPSFVFLVTLPVVAQEDALGLSRQAASLLEQALGR